MPVGYIVLFTYGLLCGQYGNIKNHIKLYPAGYQLRLYNKAPLHVLSFPENVILGYIKIKARP